MSMIDVSNLTFGYEGSPELIFDHVGFRSIAAGNWALPGGTAGERPPSCGCSRGSTRTAAPSPPLWNLSTSPTRWRTCPGRDWRWCGEIAPEAEDWEIQRELGLLDLAERSLELPFSSLSNGERTKVLLAAMFLKENAFLLIDEPTNHLDLEGRRKLGSYLARKRGFLLVSHDRAFLDQCVDHILAINRTNIEIQRGNFSSWWENRRRQDAFELARQEKLQKDIGG